MWCFHRTCLGVLIPSRTAGRNVETVSGVCIENKLHTTYESGDTVTFLKLSLKVAGNASCVLSLLFGTVSQTLGPATREFHPLPVSTDEQTRSATRQYCLQGNSLGGCAWIPKDKATARCCLRAKTVTDPSSETLVAKLN